MLDVTQYRRTQLSYGWDQSTRAFTSGYSGDWHVFIVWPEARHLLDAIRAGLEEEFVVHLLAEHRWTPEKLEENAARLYRRIPSARMGIPKKIGNGNFHSIVVEDPSPVYLYDRTVSGQVACVNKKVVRHKARYRELAQGYGVHSSNNLEEFFEQAALLYGPALLRNTLGDGSGDEVVLGDLSGAHGWKDPGELFEVLNSASAYVVLRNFDHLPAAVAGGDVDVLCDDVGAFIAAANGKVANRMRPYKAVVRIGSEDIPFDVRYQGDGYVDASWARDILRRHTIHNGLINRPGPDDLFFSLLYHAKVQKLRLKEDYIEQLPRLAREIGMDWFSADDVTSDEGAANILNGYLEAAGYRYTLPIDRGVEQNRKVIDLFAASVRPDRPGPMRRVREFFAGVIARSPGRLRQIVPAPLKQRVKRFVFNR